MIMSLEHGAVFYVGVNYSGEGYAYEESVIQNNLPPALNDRFRSVDIKPRSKVYAWRHYGDGFDQYYDFDVSQPDIQSVGGVSTILVAPKDSALFAIRLVGQAGDDRKYHAFVRTFTITNPKEIESGSGYEIVGLIPIDGRDYVTDIIIFDAGDIPVLHGAVYVRYDASKKTLLSTIYSELFPIGELEFNKVSDYQFDLKIISIPGVLGARSVDFKMLKEQLS
ncbi:hypothetical protein AO286_12345 [Pseudomonas syringae]|nr:hypothetical protein AL046_26735 [Pseudomonas syringae pv. avii]PHN65389.1 hypothetical protein AO286_12345 [Pseudomonas syringae]